MLQQTQVTTVVPYFERFMQRFPDVRALADADLDHVLRLWSGLGYYARARHLHRAARQIRDSFDGAFPTRFDDVAALPGIGRSTAGAILALSRGERHAILDGNVRRVLARYFGVDGDPTRRRTQETLWEHAERCTPREDVATYTQAIMDLGATLCTRHQPRCGVCPLAHDCHARLHGRQHELPAPRPVRRRDRRQSFMLLAVSASGDVLLERRAPSGIWGGLWCPPQFQSRDAAERFADRVSGTPSRQLTPLAPLSHTFTHFDLTLMPLHLRCGSASGVEPELPDGLHWHTLRDVTAVGLPAPVKRLLQQLRERELPSDPFEVPT